MADHTGEHFGNYRLVRLLGQGGFAQVYLGQHVRFKQQAAIKVLNAHLSGQEAAHFQQEAETIAQLSHPSIVRVFDFDVQDGTPFLVMEYAPGGSLRQRYPKGIPLPLPPVVSYVKQIADALQYAHEQKFIHRDVKPENLLLGRREEVLLSDFGIATIAHSSGSLNTKEAVGTLAYMAPEQIEGHPRAVSDQYALGCVVYEWLCGARPFEGSPTEVMVQQLSMPPPPLHEKVATIPLGVEQVVVRALAKDPKDRFASVAAFAVALEEASQHAYAPTSHIPGEQLLSDSPAPAGFATVAVSNEVPPAIVAQSALPAASADPGTPAGVVGNGALAATPPAIPLAATTPVRAEVLLPPTPALPVRRKGVARLPTALLIGLVVLIVAGTILGSVSLLAHIGVLGAHSGASTLTPVRGGTWATDFAVDPNTLIPDTSYYPWAVMAQQALYLPLFYGDAHGVVHPGAATDIPTVQNGGVSADATTWTFHLRPHLLWSDGQPYDARDVAYTWKLMLDPAFYYNGSLPGLNPAGPPEVSTDHLSITFHLKQPYAPFLSLWIDGYDAPLPAHHFGSMTPQAILKSADLLNPQVVSGPFMMAESVPGDHYTLARNPNYYLAREGLPYLDKVIIRIAPTVASILKDLQAGSIDSYDDINAQNVSTDPQAFQRFTHYTLVTSPTSSYFLGLYFNFANTVLATHREVREAMAMAIDHQALIATVVHGFAEPICSDHGSFYHPGYDPSTNCPPANLAAANKLLDDNGWVKGPDGVRTKGKLRLEFMLSTDENAPVRLENEVLVQHELSLIGIKLDIQNFNAVATNSFLSAQASPPSGAVAGRNDIAEFAASFSYDPDDSELLGCAQWPRYCNPALYALYQQELETVDPVQRQQIFGQIHQIYLTDLPFIPLYFPLDVTVVRKGTHNFQPSPFAGETINIWQWWCDHGKC